MPFCDLFAFLCVVIVGLDFISAFALIDKVFAGELTRNEFVIFRQLQLCAWV